MNTISPLREAEQSMRRTLIRQLHQEGDTPTSLAARLGSSAGSTALVRYDMIALELWTPTPRPRGSKRFPEYRRKTVRRDVAAELVLAILQAEEALDAIVVAGGVPRESVADTRLLAARAQIRHARAIARQHGLLADDRGARP